MPSHLGDGTVHASPLHVLQQVALDQRFEQNTQCVQGRSDAGQDQHHREDLARGRQRLDLAETDGRDRRDRLVDGVEKAEAEQQVSHGAQGEHQRKRQQRQPDPPNDGHRLDCPALPGHHKLGMHRG